MHHQKLKIGFSPPFLSVFMIFLIVRFGGVFQKCDCADVPSIDSNLGYNQLQLQISGAKNKSHTVDRLTKSREEEQERDAYSTESYPETIDLPNNVGALYNLSFVSSYVQHPGYVAAVQSSIMDRSHQAAYLILMGQSTMAGRRSDYSAKSQFVKFLLSGGRNFEAGEDNDDNDNANNTESAIREWTFPAPVFDLGLLNLNLKVIDIPDLDFSEAGIFRNSEILAGLESFLKSHDELNFRWPNIVLYFKDQQNDNLISTFDLDLMDLPVWRDQIYHTKEGQLISNVINVVNFDQQNQTHVNEKGQVTGSKSPDTGRESHDQYLVLRRPWAGFYHSKPNPWAHRSNWALLAQKIDDSLQTIGDKLGRAIFHSFFSKNKGVTPRAVRSSRFEIPQESQSIYSNYLRKFYGRQVQISNETKDICLAPNANSGNLNAGSSSQISATLQGFFDYLNPQKKKKHLNDLTFLKNFFDRENIRGLSDLPKTLPSTVTLFQKLPYSNLFFRAICEKALGLVMPQLPDTALTHIGHGFDLIDSRALPSPIFQFQVQQSINAKKWEASPLGFLVPDSLDLQLVNEVKQEVNIFQTTSQFLNKRFKDRNLNFQWSQIQNLIYSMPVTPPLGVNIIDQLTRPMLSPSQKNQNDGRFISGVKEFQKFRLTLKRNAPLSQEFRSAVLNHPPYSRFDPGSLQSWKNFFNFWGRDVVRSAVGGGAIIIQIPLENPAKIKTNSNSNPAVLQLVHEKADRLNRAFHQIDELLYLQIKPKEGTNNSNPYNNIDLSQIFQDCKLTFIGCDPDFYFSSPILDTMTWIEVSDLLKSWENSLNYAPQSLSFVSTDIELTHIAELIDRIDPSKAIDAMIALNDLINGNMIPIITTTTTIPTTTKTTTTTTTTVAPPSKEETLLHALTWKVTQQFQLLNQRLDFQGHQNRVNLNETMTPTWNLLRTLKTQTDRSGLDADSLRRQMTVTQDLVTVFQAESAAQKEMIKGLKKEIERREGEILTLRGQLNRQMESHRNHSEKIIATMNAERMNYNREMDNLVQTMLSLTANYTVRVDDMSERNAERVHTLVERLVEERAKHDDLIKDVEKNMAEERSNLHKEVLTILDKSLAETKGGQAATQALIKSFDDVVQRKEETNDKLVNAVISRLPTGR